MRKSALEPLAPVLNMGWNPQLGKGDITISERSYNTHMIMDKLATASKIALYHKQSDSSAFSIFYKQGTLQDKNRQTHYFSDALEADSLSWGSGLQVHSFWGSSDNTAINECGFFSQDMMAMAFVLAYFFTCGNHGVEFAWGDLDESLDELVRDFCDFIYDEYDDEEEVTAWIEECTYLIKGLAFAFSPKAGPLIAEIDIFFKDICNGFDGSLTEQNLRSDFSVFLSMFWGNDEIPYRTCLNVISSSQIGRYIKIRKQIPDPEKVLIEKAISVFSQPINHEAALTQVYFNEDDMANDMATVVFLTYEDSDEDCSVHLDMLHPLYGIILQALHHDIDVLLEKYAPAQ